MDSNPELSGSKVCGDVPKAPSYGLEFPGKDAWGASDSPWALAERFTRHTADGEVSKGAIMLIVLGPQNEPEV